MLCDENNAQRQKNVTAHADCLYAYRRLEVGGAPGLTCTPAASSSSSVTGKNRELLPTHSTLRAPLLCLSTPFSLIALVLYHIFFALLPDVSAFFSLLLPPVLG